MSTLHTGTREALHAYLTSLLRRKQEAYLHVQSTEHWNETLLLMFALQQLRYVPDDQMESLGNVRFADVPSAILERVPGAMDYARNDLKLWS